MKELAMLIRFPFFIAGLFFVTIGYAIGFAFALVIPIIFTILEIIWLPFKFVGTALSNKPEEFKKYLSAISENMEFNLARGLLKFENYKNLGRWLSGESK
jgi:hypothetical protein